MALNLIALKDAATRLGTSVNALKNAHKSNKLQIARIAGKPFVTEEGLEAYVATLLAVKYVPRKMSAETKAKMAASHAARKALNNA
jgi:hypothetical protein